MPAVRFGADETGLPGTRQSGLYDPSFWNGEIPMKTLLAAVLASASFVTVALAGEMQGVVSAVDAEAMVIVMEDGAELAVADGVSLDGIEPGASVVVTTDDSDTVIAIVAD